MLTRHSDKDLRMTRRLSPRSFSISTDTIPEQQTADSGNA